MIFVHRPRLPTAKYIMPYLQEIDDMRWYSNFGPQVIKFEHRLAEHFKVSKDMLATAANGTLMLVSILKALNLVKNSLCIMPSWTFVATAAAACYADLTPYFVDVDVHTQALNPLVLKKTLAHLKHPIGAVIVVAPFGAPIDRAAWDKFYAETSIPVVIDAAAAFDTVSNMGVGSSPIMISLHATKVFGIGEGALVLSNNAQLVKNIKLNTSFGFNANREALSIGYNAKLSEYTAAVGLAALDAWAETRQQWEVTRNHYMRELEKIPLAHWFSPHWVSGTCNVILDGNAEIAASKLLDKKIDTRRWWLSGCHQQAAYRHFPREKDLKVTEWLSQSVLGLPFSIDLEPSDIQYICSTLKNISKEINVCESTRDNNLIFN